MSDERKDDPPRRVFLKTVGRVAMVGGLAASYGTCAVMSGRFLYPAQEQPRAWQLVTEVARIPTGEAYEYRAPNGAPINIARRTGKDVADSGASEFIALSSNCPHLGCQVHWQSSEKRFFCPCHNGVFTPEGKAVSGPPAEAGQNLDRYPLQVDSGLLYILVPMVGAATASATRAAPSGFEQWRRGYDLCTDENPDASDPDEPPSDTQDVG